MLAPPMFSASRLPRIRSSNVLLAKGLRLLTYFGIAFACLFMFFSFGQSNAHAGSPDTIDLTIKTLGSGETVQLPLGTGNTFTNVVISWGDGSGNSTVANAADTTHMAHTYSTAGTYNLTVGAPATGSIVQFGNGNAPWVSGAAYVSAATYWSPSLQSLSGAFYGATNLVGVPATFPTSTTNTSYMFYDASSINDPNIKSWLTGNVTNMSYMFYQATSFNQNINTSGSNWSTANVTNMTYMFYGAVAFDNGSTSNDGANSLNAWNTAKVTNMSWMFAGAILFNQNISSWNTAAVTNMSYMFFGGTTGPVFTTAMIFNDGSTVMSTSGNSWNVGAVTAFDYMFANDTAFNVAMASWAPTTSANTMTYMFYGDTAFNQNLSTWNVSKTTNMSYMFYGAIGFNQGSTAGTVASAAMSWTMGATVTNMSYMFYGATGFNADIHLWNTSAVTNMSYMFDGATAFNDGGVSMATNATNNWKVSAVTTMSYMFYNATHFVIGGLSNWVTTALQQMQYMFYGSLENETLSSWVVTALTAGGMLDWENGSFTVINYSATLVRFAANATATVAVTAQVPASPATYYNFAGATARTTLNGKGWAISGDTTYPITSAISNNGVNTLGSTVVFTATVTGTNPPNQAPSAANVAGMWTVTGGATSCTGGLGTASIAGLVTTYTCSVILVNGGVSYNASYNY